MKEALKVFAGSCAVYAIMAACSSGGGAPNSVSMAGSQNGAHGGMQGMGGVTSGGAMSGGALGHGGTSGSSPVPDASAQTDSGTTGPQVNTAQCNTTIGGDVYAQVNYPGRTVVQLAQVHAIGQLTASSAAGSQEQALAILVDGSARVYCGTPPTALVFTSVTFVLP